MNIRKFLMVTTVSIFGLVSSAAYTEDTYKDPILAPDFIDYRSVIDLRGDEFYVIGDMMIPKEEVVEFLPTKVRRWPNGQVNVFFEICPNDGTPRDPAATCFYDVNVNDEVDLIRDAFNMLSAASQNSIVFTEHGVPGAFIMNMFATNVGTRGGRCTLGYYSKMNCSIDRAGGGFGSLETILHELMHSLGFAHEHQKADRDDYITVNSTIVETNSVNFGLKDTGVSFGTYDFCSIMHYDNRLRDPDGTGPELPQQVFATKNPMENTCGTGGGEGWGNNGLSALDIAKITRMYANNEGYAVSNTNVCRLTDNATIPTDRSLFSLCEN